MEVNLLEEREDGYHLYCVILNKGEVLQLNELMELHDMEDLSETLKTALGVGMEM